MRKEQKFKVVEVTMKRRIPLLEKTCPQCGKRFLGEKRSIYCSKACAKRASYWRRPEVYRQKRLESYQRQKKQTAKKTTPHFLSDLIRDQ